MVQIWKWQTFVGNQVFTGTLIFGTWGFFNIHSPIPKMRCQLTSLLYRNPPNSAPIYLVFSITAIKKTHTQTLYDKLNTTTSLLICFSACPLYSKKENVQSCFPLRGDKIERIFKPPSVTRPLKGSKDILSSPLEDQVSGSEVWRGTSSRVSLLDFPSLSVAAVDTQTHLFSIFSFWRA